MPARFRIRAPFKLDAEYTEEDWGSMRGARSAALQEAERIGMTVAIERWTDGPLEGREGFERGRNVPQAKVVLVVEPDGTFRAPETAEAPGGVRHKATGVCFCSNCRAARR